MDAKGLQAMTDLKPCPFCGSSALIDRDWRGQDDDGGYYEISCTNCTGRADRFIGVHSENRESAVLWWNTRGQSVQPAQCATVSDADLGDVTRHGTNCGYFDEESGCTCSLRWRQALATEREMHRAWRKRAEEGELAKLADSIKAERDRLAGRITPSVWRLMDDAIKLLTAAPDESISATDRHIYGQLEMGKMAPRTPAASETPIIDSNILLLRRDRDSWKYLADRANKRADEAEALAMKLNSGEELQSLMKLNDQLLAQVEGLKGCLDDSQSLLVAIHHLGASAGAGHGWGITTKEWHEENLSKQLADQISENRSNLSSTVRTPEVKP